MAPTARKVPPPISWAQTGLQLFINIDVECLDIETDVTENSFTFKGTNALDASKKYEVTLNFLKPIEPESVKCINIGRCVEYRINKKEYGPYWQSLTNDNYKLHFLKINFNKWKNDPQDDEEKNPYLYDDMMSNTGPNTFNDMHDFNITDDEDDEDDNIPSLSQNDEDEEDKKDGGKKDQEK